MAQQAGNTEPFLQQLFRGRLKIVSGGQTGVDRAALDWAIANGLPHGGWCPRGRLAEDGTIPERYALEELPDGGYRQRTKANVRDSDGTLILNLDELEGGTLLTRQFAERLNKPWKVVQVDEGLLSGEVESVVIWLAELRIQTLNVAGPRESKRPGVYAATLAFLDAVRAMAGASGEQGDTAV